MSSNLFSIGLSGLNAAQWGLTTTGQNISNQATPGYSVERPVYSESSGQYTGSGYLGSGVSTTTIQRQYSQYLTTELNNAQSQSGSLNTYYNLIAQLNNMVGNPTSGISSAITSYFTGMQNVANDASNPAMRQSAISSAQSLADQINAAGDQYDQLRTSVNTQIGDTVKQINTYSAQIAQLNSQIQSLSAQGQPPNQLLDQRDLAVSNLSQLVGVQVVQGDSGYSVFMGNGQPLVVADKSFNLTTVTSPSDPTETAVAYAGLASQAGTTTPQILPDSAQLGGQIGGLMTFRSQTLDPAEAQLGAIATSFAAQVNAQNSLGIDLNGNKGGALFTVGNPTIFANLKNTGGATLGASLSNPSQPVSGDYTLSYDGSNYTLTNRDTGQVVGQAANLTNPIGGMQFSLTGTMNAGDSFTVEPTRGALNGFGLTTSDGAAIAASSPVLVSKGTSNTGTSSVTQGTVSSGYTLPSTTTTLTYDSTTGSISGFPVGSTVTIGGTPPTSYNITAATPNVPYNPAMGASMTITGSTINNVSLQITGTPANGDTFTIAPNPAGGKDGRNAQSISNLVTTKSMGNGTLTLTDSYANYVNDIGNQTNQIQASSKSQTALVTQITTSQQAISGVNINEEAANLLQYQQLYQANSKVIQTAQTLFQTILGIFQ
ncbi:flagellar hook-associated protein FlgK [Paraburkholderia hospita]|jgi:flagellar hook-associated protein 1 FlgK|uniref:Flagellar hook-associated protein 1 n=1 Tax=Paraburkholderia hospita TaxID=169430 RepID=A0AAN1MK10_9BURK|nr:flagellar hook-associated protein FlgK [Paraburkholderia hospita]SOE60952.1 flagellar hook-associated protein FlgK [Burkholderia sp. YR290]AUT69880.1 flagellar hook-associated protein FlgK [Paraburkholderia hospita]EIN02828.1 flagellar hook-associated protein FlgK [Paraburkholderia hospita]OUL77971.1 flagellar hook-associated protein FlgK [Paraburkholderia hospita]SEI28628.1 flagellar hook-associated protein 1 FlgK [Paraburkholderia hospita]